MSEDRGEDRAFAAARAGDEQSFRELIEPHLRALTGHCYRMLGSLSDAEDALQDALLRAWRGLPGFEGRASFRSWLFKVATHACLDAAQGRRRRALPFSTMAAADPTLPFPAPQLDAPWIEPLPSKFVADADVGPEAQYAARESTALAFLTALEVLTARQRAVLVLRDAMGFTAEETAEMLDTSVAGTNSALQRARSAVAEQRRALGVTRPPEPSPEASELLEQVMRAWEAGDARAVVTLLSSDVILSMPPLPLWYRGMEHFEIFLDNYLFRGDAAGRYRVLPTSANGHPAFGVYRRNEAGFEPLALNVVVVVEGRIAEFHSFLAMDRRLSFERFGLPSVLF